MPIICKKKSVDLQAYHCETIGEANLKNVQTVKYEKWKSMQSSLWVILNLFITIHAIFVCSATSIVLF